jgi:hypothetical protein
MAKSWMAKSFFLGRKGRFKGMCIAGGDYTTPLLFSPKTKQSKK